MPTVLLALLVRSLRLASPTSTPRGLTDSQSSVSIYQNTLQHFADNLTEHFVITKRSTMTDYEIVGALAKRSFAAMANSGTNTTTL